MTATLIGEPKQDPLHRKISLRLLPFLTLCYMFAFLDRINVGFAKLEMQSSLGLSDAAYGLGAGIFFLGYVLFEIPSNLRLPKIGARRTMVRIMVLWGLTSAAMIFVQGPISFYVLRFLLGVFEAGFAPGMVLYLTYWIPGARLGKTMAIVMAAGPLGGLLGGPVSTIAMTSLEGAYGLAGWQWMFIVEGLPCVLFGLFAWFWLTDRPEQANWLTGEEKAMLRAAIPGDSGHVETLRGLLNALADRRILGLGLSNLCVICGIYAVSFWLPSILKAAGLNDTRAIGWWSALPYIASLAAMYGLSVSSDRMGERRRHFALASLMGAVGLLVASRYASLFEIALPAVTIATAAMWAAYTVLWAIPGEYMGTEVAPGGIAVVNVLGVVGGFLSPVLMGLITSATGRVESGLLPMVGLMLLGAGVMLLNRFPGRGKQ
ncbi:MFS transporter [Achromobacter aloeverae]|uniref:MFS transporter n=1 Tax=Achromobacter aloeverae TaxID=1750518 RepID=A0A4Q1HDQ5_9BURK|nr:MFS transporter [Achromobacter aloeverae]RXN83341.1 MFS transporter [Achromobacter aloeverae]